MRNSILITILILFCTSCYQYEIPSQEDVWVPIYGDANEINEIKLLAPKNTINGGKIYAWNNYFFQLEPLKGIHVFERKATSAAKIHFIQVLGAQEISIKDGFLYTNNYKDLVTININDWNNLTVSSRLENAFSIGNLLLPPTPGYFQCVDTSKGTVIGWELQHNIPANCQY